MQITNFWPVWHWNLEVSQGDPDKIPSTISMRDIYTPNLVIPGQFFSNILSRKQVHKLLTSVTLKVGQDDPHTTPSQIWWSQASVVSNISSRNQIHKLLTSVTFKLGEDDLHTIPSTLSTEGAYTHNLVIPGKFVINILRGKHFYDEYTNWTSVTLKLGKGDPHTIPIFIQDYGIQFSPATLWTIKVLKSSIAVYNMHKIEVGWWAVHFKTKTQPDFNASFSG